MTAGLVPYGIADDVATFRIHVCPIAGCIYLFRTAAVRDLIAASSFPQKTAQIDGVITAEGWLVPVDLIPGLVEIEIPAEILSRVRAAKDASTDERGEVAERTVQYALQKGLIPLPMTGHRVTDRALQIAGIDLVASTTVSVQVKYDHKGGAKSRGGTGNVYVQSKERHS